MKRNPHCPETDRDQHVVPAGASASSVGPSDLVGRRSIGIDVEVSGSTPLSCAPAGL